LSQDDFFNWVERSIVADDPEASRDQAH